MAHVFVSYAHEDGDFAKALITKLKQASITHWVDSEHLRAGQDWRQAIDEAIRASFALLVIMSPTAKTSEYVTYEWAFAWGVGIPVIPVLYQLAVLHPRLEALQYLDFTHRMRPWDKLVEELKLLERGYTPPIAPNIPLDSGTQKLIEDLSSANPQIRRQAIEALGNIGDPIAGPALIERLQSDESWAARQDAIYALVKLGDQTATRSLIRAVHRDGSIHVRVTAAWALGEFKSQEATESLLEVLERAKRQELPTQRAAAVALGKIGNKSVAPRLLKLMRTLDLNVCARIIETLGYFGETVAIAQIASYLNNTTSIFINDEQRPMNQIAAEALERIGTPEAISALKEWRIQATN